MAATLDLDVLADRVVGLAEVNSGSHNPEGVDRCGERVAELFAPLNPSRVEHLPVPPTMAVTDSGEVESRPVGRALVVSQSPDAPFQVLLFGHLDTVFGPDSTFQTVTRGPGDRLAGPGVADCKGGLVVAVEALERIQAAAWGDQVGWTFMAVPDEEVGSHGSKAMLAAEASSCDLGLGFEPALPSGGVAGARKGTMTAHVVVRGRAAHVGRAHGDGRSAIRALARLVEELESHNDPARNLGGALTVNCGHIVGGGALNAVPDLAVAGFNLRVATADAHTHAEQLFEAAVSEADNAEGISVELHWTGARPPKLRDAALSTLLDDLASTAEELGLEVAIEDTGGCCDGNDLATAGLVNVDSLGIRGGGIHSPDEFAVVSSIPERASLVAALVHRRLGRST